MFTANGGEVVGALRVPLKNPEFAPFVQRIKDAKPEAVFIFTPAGETAVAFMKAFAERGLDKAGIKLIATGDVTDDDVIDAMGDAALGVITTHHYSAAAQVARERCLQEGVRRRTRERTRGRTSWRWAAGTACISSTRSRPSSVGAIDGDKAVAAAKGMTIESPRGTIAIDPATRDVVQDVYVRKVQKIDGKYFNVEFDKLAKVKDPGKS